MNKPRPSALPLKKAIRVTPPTPPRFFSFSSFRVKKSQGQREGEASGESNCRRRSASGDREYSSSEVTSFDSLLPTCDSGKFPSSIEYGGVSTFKSLGTESAPSSPYSRPDYRFLKESATTKTSGSPNTIELDCPTDSYGSQGQVELGCGSNRSLGGTSSEMHKGYFDRNGGTNHSVTDITDLHGKPPTGISRHQTLRSNSEPHGHSYYGSGAEVSVGPLNHGISSIYGNNIVLEDQGIDMSQSPGHESPSSTVSSNTISVSGGSGVSSSAGSGSTGHSRHSATSFDSGRASSSLYQQGVRYSGLSSESSSTGSCRHSYHSSSSSLGSIPPEEICNFDVSSMVAQGLPDSEILNAWLTGVHFECYYQNFIQAGYDMQTILKMTPEDLNAIGITKPNHRKRLKSEISQLIIPDGLPDYIPNTIEEWLRALRMEEYTEKLKAQGYTNVRQVTNITWEDLEDIGILKLGHQKKFLLAIKRVEDILSGKRLHTSGTQNSYHPSMECYAAPHPHRNPQLLNHASQMPYSQHNTNHGQMPSATRGYSMNPYQKGFTSQQSVPPFNSWRHHPGGKDDHYSYHHGEGIYSTNEKPHMQLLTHQPQIHQEKPPPVTNGLSQPEYHPEVIAIHVKNERRPSAIADSSAEPIYGTSSFQAPASQNLRSGTQSSKWVEDGETTPTNEAETKGSGSSSHSIMESSPSVLGNSTLPRLMKNKAFGKTPPGGAAPSGQEMKGNDAAAAGLDITYQDQCSGTSAQWQQHQSSTMDGYKSLPKNMGRFQSTFRGNGSSASPGMKQPPPPPRRSSSSSAQEGRQETFSTFHPTSCSLVKQQPSGWSNNANDHDLPAPPPPEDLALISGSSCENPSVPSSADPSQSNYSVNNTSTSASLIGSSNNAASSSTSASNFHQYTTYAGNSSTNIAVYSNSNNSRIYPSTSVACGRLRDPSPGACDSDLSTFSSMGVRRNGSDASFKSSSSTESESLPFANDNAGTIKQQKPGSRAAQGTPLEGLYGSTAVAPAGEQIEAGDVLSDIGNMLADLTDELDAILQQEMDSLNKR